jgi:hypothetical protein
MRILTTSLLCIALGLAFSSVSSGIGHHHRSVDKQVNRDVKKARKKAAKLQRPKLLHHHK